MSDKTENRKPLYVHVDEKTKASIAKNTKKLGVSQGVLIDMAVEQFDPKSFVATEKAPKLVSVKMLVTEDSLKAAAK